MKLSSPPISEKDGALRELGNTKRKVMEIRRKRVEHGIYIIISNNIEGSGVQIEDISSSCSVQKEIYGVSDNFWAAFACVWIKVISRMYGLRVKHQIELEGLTLTTQPFRTLKLFALATARYFKQSISYLFSKGGWILISTALLVALSVLLITVDGPHEKHVQEFLHYFRFGLWWVALGVASSIGLGSGLHTFVLYLGPHIALFTIKSMHCGRVDLKSAPYDTIQLKSGPSWLDKDCSEFGPPLFPSVNGLRVPLSSILPQVQLEAILWGLGTALGELPPYFISRAGSGIYVDLSDDVFLSKSSIRGLSWFLAFALENAIICDKMQRICAWSYLKRCDAIPARASGSKFEAMEELDASSEEDGVVAKKLTQMKRWFLSHSQHLNFFTILVLASVPNPLFDLAGIMCGQFGIPFWKFFLATLTGKAIIKTHIQTVFIISVCNNQLLEWIENELIWVLGFVPGLSSILPKVIAKLHMVKEKYLLAASSVPVASTTTKVKNWDLSLASIWNTVVWLMLLNFFAKIVTSTAQRYLKKQQDKEMIALTQAHNLSVPITN
ncbi:hypothetical protein GIB67_029055 [Kingdonia uniflora]|uniref:Vacuole membrane protein KMS1 n=1 Tax=Kingdonia uniflora TaxID=39325 RepID=A0A7J7N6L8_9MAGN|nr:hypothetical protein GIB67_029055 [Kingdonia uniflora]